MNIHRGRGRWVAWLLVLASVELVPAPRVASVAEAAETTAAPRAKTPATDNSADNSAGDETPAVPPALTHYMGREIAQTMHYLGAPWLIRESRQREEDCETMLRELGVRESMVVCDMGCGNGFYTLQMARQVGQQGKVLAVDIQPEMLRLLEARADEEDLGNIDLLLGSVVDPKLPRNQVDLILCVDVYHEFSHPEPMLAAMRAALKPDGLVVLVEFREEDPEVPIKPLHKMSKRQIEKEMRANGLKLVRQFDGLPWQHMMFFGRDEDWRGGSARKGSERGE